MDGRLIDRIESGAGQGASALFAAAAGYAAYGMAVATGLEPQLGLCAAGVGALAYLPCNRLLGMADDRGRRFVLPEFAAAEFEFVESREEVLLTERFEPAELLLTEADRFDARPALDGSSTELDPDSRVVRLFDRDAMGAEASSGLRSLAVGHDEGGATGLPASIVPVPSDASQALSVALDELRRSLR